MATEERPITVNTTSLKSILLAGWRPYLLIASIVFLLYVKTTGFRLTYFDDNILLLHNNWFLRDIRNAFAAFRTGVFLGGDDYFYRPLLTLSLMLDTQLGGPSFLFFHLTNILIHAMASCLVFTLFQALGYRRALALFISLLFAVHPALTQAVAWIPGRNDSLLALFFLPSFISFLRFCQSPTLRPLIAHLLFFVLALFTKETAFALPVLCVLYSRLYTGTLLPAKHRIPLLTGWGIAVSLWIALRYTVITPLQGPTLAETAVTLRQVIPSLLQYIGKAVLPLNLSVYPLVVDTTSLFGVLSVIIICLALTMSHGRNMKNILFGAAWFLLLITPPFFMPDLIRFEHRLYLPIIGLLFLLAETGPAEAFHLPSKLVLPLKTVVLAILAGTAFLHSDRFMNRLVYWKNAVAASPHSVSARINLSMRYAENGLTDLSFQELKNALALSPNDANVRLQLGLMYMEKGLLDDAERQFAIVRDIRSDCTVLCYNVGRLRYLQGREREAEEQWKKALTYNPNHLLTYKALALLYYKQAKNAQFQYCCDVLRSRFGVTINPADFPRPIQPQWFYSFTG